MKKIMLVMFAGLLAADSLHAVLPHGPTTRDLTTLKMMFEETKSAVVIKLQQLKIVAAQFNKQDLFEREFKNIEDCLGLSGENSCSEADIVEKYQNTIGRLEWYLLQMSGWLEGLAYDGENFHITYLK